jgi:hypothetical protein
MPGVSNPLRVTTTDYYPAGEPFRIIAPDAVRLECATMLDKRADVAGGGLRLAHRPPRVRPGDADPIGYGCKLR